MRAVERLVSLLTTLPSRGTWHALAIIFVLYALLATLIASGSGFIKFSPLPLTGRGYLRLALVLLVAPSGLEESLFRAFLLPRSDEHRALLYAALSLTLYVLSHPMSALLFRPSARNVFTSPRFLVMVTLLGVACTAATWTSGSLWPSIFIHWLTVFVWLGLLGGRAALGR